MAAPLNCRIIIRRGQFLTSRAWRRSEVSKRCESTAMPVQEEISQPRSEDVASIAIQHPDYFSVRDLVNVPDLFKARVHLGHKKGLRNTYMSPYLYGSRLDCDIFDLDQTVTLFQDALNFAAHIAYRGGIILFISRHRQTIPLVEKTAKLAGEYANCRYWKGGTFTNANNQFDTVTRLPDLCIFLNSQNNVLNPHTAIVDCAKMLIPTAGILDSNCDPRLVSYPVPGNDDSPVAVEYYCEKLKAAILKGKAKRKEDGFIELGD